jgi:hypothetical protein
MDLEDSKIQKTFPILSLVVLWPTWVGNIISNWIFFLVKKILKIIWFQSLVTYIDFPYPKPSESNMTFV